MADGRVVIETNLDTSGINRGLNTLRSSLGNIDTSRLSGGLQRVTQQLNEVGRSAQTQRTRLEQLRREFNSSTDVGRRNVLRDQMRETEAEITRLGGRFDELSTRARADLARIADSGRSTSESLRSIGDSMQSAGRSMSTKLTLPILAIGTAAAKVGMDFEAQMSRVKAISGATGDEFKQLNAQALQLGSDTAFSAMDAAKGMEGLASAGFSVKETMTAMPGLLDLAASSGEDLATSTDIAASTLRGFGLEASQTGHVADVLAKNAGATNAAVRDTGEAMKYVAPVAHTMGLGLEEVTAAIGEMANSGIKGSQAGTTLRSALVRLASPADPAAAAMEKIGFNAFDLQGKMKPLSTIIDEYSKALKGKTDQQKQDITSTIFGQEALSGMTVLMEGGKESLDNLTNSYKNADGAAKEMATTMQDNAKSSVEQMVGSLETAGIKIEKALAPTITKYANKIQDLANAFSELSPEQQEFYIKMALGLAAIGPVTTGIGKLASGIGTIGTAGRGAIDFFTHATLSQAEIAAGSTTATTGFAKLIAKIAAITPVGWAAAASIAAIAVGTAAYVTHSELMSKSCDTTSESLNGWEQAVNAVTGSTIKSKAELQKAGIIYKDFGEGVGDSFKEGIQKATDEYHNFEVLLNQSDLSKNLAEANQGKIAASINKIIDGAKKVINDRKGELQKDLMAGMTADGSGIDTNEQTVLDIVGKSSDEKLAKVAEIQGKITETWDNAIKNHGKLSSQDVEIIQNYMKQIERLKMEASAKNEAESTFTENSFMERMNGLSAEDAKKEYGDTSKTIHDNYAKLKATYKTETDELNLELKKVQESGTKDQVAAIEKEISDKNNLYDKALTDEQGKRRKLLNMIYEKNPSLKGQFNEIDGGMFSPKDLNSQADLKKIESTYTEVANATKTGIKHVQDSLGGWHDISVTVDESTGNIVSAFDINAREGETAIGGYSETFEKSAKEAAEKAKDSARKLSEAFSMDFASLVSKNGKTSKVQLQGDSLINIDTGTTISQFDTIITKADETKVAIANINGVQVKIEFNEDGTIKNAEDVKKAVVDKLANSPAKVGVYVDSKAALEKFKQLEDLKTQLDGKELKQKIVIDGEETNSIDTVINKLENLPKGKNIDLKINGEEVNTIDMAIEKLKKVPEETNTEIKADNSEANEKIEETGTKADDLDDKEPEVTATADTSDAEEKVDALGNKINNMPKNPKITVHIGSMVEAVQGVASIAAEGLKEVLAKPYSNYTGTNGGYKGITEGNEHGWEMSTGESALYLMNGGGGISDHMTSVNEMKSDVNSAVDNKVGKVVNTLVVSLARQNGILKEVARNTGDTATNSKETANNIISNINKGTTGSFTGLKNEIDMANLEKERTSNLKVDNYDYYASAKQTLDELNGQIDEMKDKIENTTDESVKKQLEADQKVLEKKKDSAAQEESLAKEVAQREIEESKTAAEQQVKIAEEKKEKLTKLAEAVSEAIKNEITKQKDTYDKAGEIELKALETSYNKKTKTIEDSLKKQTDKIDKRIKDLEEETTDNSRDKERTDSKNSINTIKTKMANTASIADKRALQIELNKAQKELNEKEDSWDTEDKKTSLENEKTALATKAEKQKKIAETEYNNSKTAKEKEIKAQDEYYSKLLETDSINAQARYLMLQGSNNDLVTLLNSYNPDWQNAGQSLADSLLNGLNSQKQSIADAVAEMGIGGVKTLAPDQKYIDSATGQMVGYASGINYNKTRGYYKTNENRWETASNGDVAYVDKGASIRNHMQSVADMKAEISKQLSNDLPFILSQMQSTLQTEQSNMRNMLMNTVNNNTSSSSSVQYDGSNNFKIENLNLNSGQDVEQFFNEAESIRIKNKKF